MVKSKKYLSYLLGYSFIDLQEICKNIVNYYYEREEIKKDKDGKIKLDKNGNPRIRILNPSTGKLKLIQTNIKRRILSKILFPGHVQGGVKKRDNISNANLHLGKKYHFCTDIENFFPTIHSQRVYEVLLSIGFSHDISSILTKLTTYKNCVPQGAPTSTYIANFVFLLVDKQLLLFCEKKNILYSRFVDDLVFSSQKEFKDDTMSLIKIIRENGFKISNKKTYYKIGPTEVTGVLTKNNVMDLNDTYKEKIKNAEIWRTKRFESLLAYYNRVKRRGKLVNFD